MSEPHYDIFFRGEILEGFELDAVKASISQLFKASPEKTEQLFSGKVIPLRKDLDKATAAKFKQALDKAGAKIYIKLAADAAPTAAATNPNTPRPAAAPAIAATTPNEVKTPAQPARQQAPAELVILPPGSDVLRADERPVVEAVNVDISGIRLASVFDQPASDKTPPPPAPDVSHLSAAPAGADILGGVKKAAPPPAPVVDHISIAAAGADLIENHEEIPVPPAPDVSHLSTAAPGADILEGVKKAVPPPAPDVSHLSLSR